jgi:integrase
MASLQQKGEGWHCQFLYHGKRHTFAIGKVSEEEAEAKRANVEYHLMRLKQGLAVLPPNVSIVEYVQHDGKPVPRETVHKTTLEQLRDQYIKVQELSNEPNTVAGIRIHFKHLIGHLGPAFPLQELSLSDLQQYVSKRAKDPGRRGGKLSPATIKKEIRTLRGAWNWAIPMKLVTGKFPSGGLHYPKGKEKPPFMTRPQIERRAKGMSEAGAEWLWEALYLTEKEIPKLLAHVKANALHPFIYPAICFVAHTGARRAEMLRARVNDVDFEGGEVTLRDKKGTKGQDTTRSVPLSPTLITALREWLAVHPGGEYLFCLNGTVDRSNKRSKKTGYKSHKTRAKTTAGRLETVRDRGHVAVSQLTPDEADDHFKRTLANSHWDVVQGWHVLRHSFISALASAGKDQRVIDDMVGHKTEQQRRRYRHLHPSTKQDAINSVFGGEDLPAESAQPPYAK